MIHTGSVVRPIAGSDQDRFFVVTCIQENRAYLCDGRKQQLSHQKKKNLKHLEDTGATLDPAAFTTNKQLRKALTSLGFCRL